MPDFNSQEDTQQRKRRIVGLVCTLLSMFFLGGTFALNKMILNEGVHPILLAFVRMVIACVVMFPLYRIAPRGGRWGPKEWKRVLFVGLAALTLAQVFEYSGTVFTTASNVSIIVSNEAIFALILSALLLKERLQKSTIVGAFWAIAGLYFILQDDLLRAEFHTGSALTGDLLALAAVICWSLYTVYSKRLTDTGGAMTALFYVSLVSAAAFGGITFVMGMWADLLKISWYVWGLILYLGVTGSGLGHIFYYAALSRLPANIVSVSLTTLPLFGVGYAMILLGETLSPLEALGGLVIVFGVGYAVWPRGRNNLRKKQFEEETI